MLYVACSGLVLAIVTMKMFDPLVILVASIYGGYMAGNAAVSMLGLGNYLAAVIGVPDQCLLQSV